MSCTRCGSNKIVKISAKCDDRFSFTYDGIDHVGNVPDWLGLGFGGDYVNISYCGECGQIQHRFPLLVPDDEPVEVKPKEAPSRYVNLGGLIDAFYENAQDINKYREANLQFRSLIKFLNPSEQEAFNHLWVMYNDMRTMRAPYPEFDSYVDFLAHRYSEVEVLEKVLMY